MGSAIGQRLPQRGSALPGERSAALVEVLAAVESPSFTSRRARRRERSGAPWDPIVWAEARGANVVDADGNLFVDLVAGFGVASIGHAHPRLVAAIGAQAGALVHGLGDVHPSVPKIRLLERLAAMAPFGEARVVLGAHGGDAIETALKTAVLDTGRPGVLAFEGGYHGLGHGPLALCGYSEAFRAPFAGQLGEHAVLAPWPAETDAVGEAIGRVEQAWRGRSIGAVFVEPIQGRGGVRIPPPGFLRALGELARSRGARVVSDEILVGLGRCGARWLGADEGLAPDLVCAGKSLGGGMPVSACLGRGEVMEAWAGRGAEAIHTATFFGHPIACAAALATLDVMEEEGLSERAERSGVRWLGRLREVAARHSVVRGVRGRGMLLGMELDSGARTLRLVPALLDRGWITLPAGASAEVLQLCPPLGIEDPLLEGFAAALDEALHEVAR